MLKNGAVSTDPRLDRVYELDWRSLDYPVNRALDIGPKTYSDRGYYPRSYTWSVNEWLDQGYEGSCVGHSFAHELVARPVEVKGIKGPISREARHIYYEAQKIDPWPGGVYEGASPQYEGTSVLAGAQVCKSLGFYDSYYWALSLEDLALGVGYLGPAVIGVNWYEGMFDTDSSGYIRPVGGLAGGHAILANSVRVVWKNWYNKFISRNWENVDLDKSSFSLHNSWGPSWGIDGTARISFRDMERLLFEQGEACFPVRTQLREWTL